MVLERGQYSGDGIHRESLSSPSSKASREWINVRPIEKIPSQEGILNGQMLNALSSSQEPIATAMTLPSLSSTAVHDRACSQQNVPCRRSTPNNFEEIADKRRVIAITKVRVQVLEGTIQGLKGKLESSNKAMRTNRRRARDLGRAIRCVHGDSRLCRLYREVSFADDTRTNLTSRKHILLRCRCSAVKHLREDCLKFEEGKITCSLDEATKILNPWYIQRSIKKLNEKRQLVRAARKILRKKCGRSFSRCMLIMMNIDDATNKAGDMIEKLRLDVESTNVGDASLMRRITLKEDQVKRTTKALQTKREHRDDRIGMLRDTALVQVVKLLRLSGEIDDVQRSAHEEQLRLCLVKESFESRLHACTEENEAMNRMLKGLEAAVSKCEEEEEVLRVKISTERGRNMSKPPDFSQALMDQSATRSTHDVTEKLIVKSRPPGGLTGEVLSILERGSSVLGDRSESAVSINSICEAVTSETRSSEFIPHHDHDPRALVDQSSRHDPAVTSIGNSRQTGGSTGEVSSLLDQESSVRGERGEFVVSHNSIGEVRTSETGASSVCGGHKGDFPQALGDQPLAHDEPIVKGSRPGGLIRQVSSLLNLQNSVLGERGEDAVSSNSIVEGRGTAFEYTAHPNDSSRSLMDHSSTRDVAKESNVKSRPAVGLIREVSRLLNRDSSGRGKRAEKVLSTNSIGEGITSVTSASEYHDDENLGSANKDVYRVESSGDLLTDFPCRKAGERDREKGFSSEKCQLNADVPVRACQTFTSIKRIRSYWPTDEEELDIGKKPQISNALSVSTKLSTENDFQGGHERGSVHEEDEDANEDASVRDHVVEQDEAETGEDVSRENCDLETSASWSKKKNDEDETLHEDEDTADNESASFTTMDSYDCAVSCSHEEPDGVESDSDAEDSDEWSETSVSFTSNSCVDEEIAVSLAVVTGLARLRRGISSS